MISQISTDGFLEDAVGGRIGDHQRGEVLAVFLGARREIGDVDVSRVITFHADDLHAGHHRGGGIRAVGGNGDQADVAVAVAAGMMIAADGEQAGVFALRAGVRLQRNGGEAGDFREPVFQQSEHLAVARALIGGHEGMERGDFRPAQRHHLGSGVEFHRAGTERDHRFVEREILGFEALDVAQHLGFRVIAVEDLLGEESRVAASSARSAMWEIRRIECRRPKSFADRLRDRLHRLFHRGKCRR